jgi:hypothetical protein
MTVRWIVFAALAVALSSCTAQHEVHEPERALLGATSCKPGAPVVGLGPATDARPTQVITSYNYDTSPWWAGASPPAPLPRSLSVPTPHEVIIGTELAEYARDSLAGCLIARGYCVKGDQHSSFVPEPARLVGVVLISADTKNTSSWELGSPLHRNRSAEVKVEVRDSSSQKVSFVGHYSSLHAMDSIEMSKFFSLSGSDAPFADHYLEQVNKAIDEAVKKACDDPAFIAVITPSAEAEPRPSSHKAQPTASGSAAFTL